MWYRIFVIKYDPEISRKILCERAGVPESSKSVIYILVYIQYTIFSCYMWTAFLRDIWGFPKAVRRYTMVFIEAIWTT